MKSYNTIAKQSNDASYGENHVSIYALDIKSAHQLSSNLYPFYFFFFIQFTNSATGSKMNFGACFGEAHIWYVHIKKFKNGV